MDKKANDGKSCKEVIIHTLVDIGEDSTPAATFVVDRAAFVVDKRWLLFVFKKDGTVIPKFTPLIIIGFF